MEDQALTLVGEWTVQQKAAEAEPWQPADIAERPYFARHAVGRAHGLFLSGDHQVYGAGVNGSGQLGLGNTETQFKLVPLPLFQQLEARMVACGSAHSVVLARTGHIFSFGSGSFGRLGVGSTRDSSKPRRVRVYAPGDEGNVEISVQFKAVACGDRHTLAIASYVEGVDDKNARVYSWGDGGSGRLGNGSDEDSWYPSLVQYWMGAKPGTARSTTSSLSQSSSKKRPYPVDVEHVAAGVTHSAAITSNGYLYTWGDGGNGRLGHGSQSVEWTPRLLLAVDQVADVACGSRHTVCRTAFGQVFAWGQGMYGQLGVGQTEDALAPMPLRTLQHIKVTTISAGDRCSVFSDAEGRVHVTGQLGPAASRPIVFVPTQVPVPFAVANVAVGHKGMLLASRVGADKHFPVPSAPTANPTGGGRPAVPPPRSKNPSFQLLLQSKFDEKKGWVDPATNTATRPDAGAVTGAVKAGQADAKPEGGGGSHSGGSGRHQADAGHAGSGPIDVFRSVDPHMRGMFDRFLKKLQQQHAGGNMLVGRPVLADKLVEKILKLNAIAAGILGTTAEREAARRAREQAEQEAARQAEEARRDAARARARFERRRSRLGGGGASSRISRTPRRRGRRPASALHKRRSAVRRQGESATGAKRPQRPSTAGAGRPTARAGAVEGADIGEVARRRARTKMLKRQQATPPPQRIQPVRHPRTAAGFADMITYPTVHELEVGQPFAAWAPQVAAPGTLDAKGDTVVVAPKAPAHDAAEQESMDAEQMAAAAAAHVTAALSEDRKTWVPGFSFGASSRPPLSVTTKGVPGPGTYKPYAPIGHSWGDGNSWSDNTKARHKRAGSVSPAVAWGVGATGASFRRPTSVHRRRRPASAGTWSKGQRDRRPGPSGLVDDATRVARDTPAPGQYTVSSQFQSPWEQEYVTGYSFGPRGREHTAAAALSAPRSPSPIRSPSSYAMSTSPPASLARSPSPQRRGYVSPASSPASGSRSPSPSARSPRRSSPLRSVVSATASSDGARSRQQPSVSNFQPHAVKTATVRAAAQPRLPSRQRVTWKDRAGEGSEQRVDMMVGNGARKRPQRPRSALPTSQQRRNPVARPAPTGRAAYTGRSTTTHARSGTDSSRRQPHRPTSAPFRRRQRPTSARRRGQLSVRGAAAMPEHARPSGSPYLIGPPTHET